MALVHPAAAIDRLKACAELLRLPWQAVATACVFFQRFKEDVAGIEVPDHVLPMHTCSPCSLQPGLCLALSTSSRCKLTMPPVLCCDCASSETDKGVLVCGGQS